jgi:putative addiction module component (TIGR02574 family)
MTTTLIQYGLDRLPAEEKLAIAEALWDSVQQESADVPGAALMAELERRERLSDADPTRGRPWADVLADVRARWRR